jgi:hypothetical protein
MDVPHGPRSPRRWTLLWSRKKIRRLKENSNLSNPPPVKVLWRKLIS